MPYKVNYGSLVGTKSSTVLKFRTLSNKMLVFKAEIHKTSLRIANKEDPDQTASSEAV